MSRRRAQQCPLCQFVYVDKHVITDARALEVHLWAKHVLWVSREAIRKWIREGTVEESVVMLATAAAFGDDVSDAAWFWGKQ